MKASGWNAVCLFIELRQLFCKRRDNLAANLTSCRRFLRGRSTVWVLDFENNIEVVV